MNKNTITEVVTGIVGLLDPLTSDERLRVVQASLTLLGESELDTSRLNGDEEASRMSTFTLSSKAEIWANQNSLSQDSIQKVFHVSDDIVDVIVSEIPGNDGIRKTLNAYVLTGITKLLISGDTKFDDKSARALCESLGCYNSKNHSTRLLKKGSLFTGSKDKGWMLTAPGLKHGAALVKDITK